MLLPWIYTVSASSRTTVNPYNPTISCKMITVGDTTVSTIVYLPWIYTGSTSSRTAVNPRQLHGLYKNSACLLTNDATSKTHLLLRLDNLCKCRNLCTTSANIGVSLNLLTNPQCLNRMMLLNNSPVIRRCYYCELLQLRRRLMLRLRVCVLLLPSFWSPWTRTSLVVTRTTPTSWTKFLSNLLFYLCRGKSTYDQTIL
jgi:hypothetical protein